MTLLKQSIKEIKALGGYRGKLFSEVLGIDTYEELLRYYPYKYQDRSVTYPIRGLTSMPHPVQLYGKVTQVKRESSGGKWLLTARLSDGTGSIQLSWFNKISAIERVINPSLNYYVFGQPRLFRSTLLITHPEIVEDTPTTRPPKGIWPLYSTTTKLEKIGLNSKAIARIQVGALKKVIPTIKENIPAAIVTRYGLLSRDKAMVYVHFAPSKELLAKARHRLKLEELLYLQLYHQRKKGLRIAESKGQVFTDTSLIHAFYKKHLPFTLTGDQKNSIKQICEDMASGHQMNRLLQGDVGSGKTIVAFTSMLPSIAHGAQVALLAPTEVLATQHYDKLKKNTEALGISTALLTGSTPRKEHKEICEAAAKGELQLMIGTHALLEDRVQFKRLGMAVIDEQHRFGVAQRAKLWEKNTQWPAPHILVLTATPIPRTLAMALYGDLDVSVIREKPAGRRPIVTTHHYDKSRLAVFNKIKEQIDQGHQVYIIYPRILSSDGEESYKDLMDGYESVQRAFPKVPVSLLHGKMLPAAKTYEMKRFVEGETKIMMGTTILEVGIDVPNATMMVIENAEAFGLAQLHQLRGRVGRDAAQSYCLLMTADKLSAKAITRIQTMVKSEDGFEVANIDLQLRGPGDLLGVQQSGVYKLRLADLTKDEPLVEKAKTIAEEILAIDPMLTSEQHKPLLEEVKMLEERYGWSSIS